MAGNVTFHGQGTPSSNDPRFAPVDFGNAPGATAGPAVDTRGNASANTAASNVQASGNPFNIGSVNWGTASNPGATARVNPNAMGAWSGGSPGAPTAAMAGGATDPFAPGFGEQVIGDTIGTMAGPSSATEAIGNGGLDKFNNNALGQYWNSIQGKLAQPRYSEQVFKDLEMPDIASEPGYGAYYDLAQQRALETIGRQAAARGGYGSSATANLENDAIVGLNADRARTEAQYNLDRLGEQRAWEQARIGAGANADNAFLGAAGLGAQTAGAVDAGKLQSTMGQLNALLASGQLDVQRYNAMVDAAIASQNLGQNRENSFISNVFAPAGQIAGVTQGGLGGVTSGDRSDFESAMNAFLGKYGSAAAESTADSEAFRADLANLVDAFTAGSSAGLF